MFVVKGGESLLMVLHIVWPWVCQNLGQTSAIHRPGNSQESLHQATSHGYWSNPSLSSVQPKICTTSKASRTKWRPGRVLQTWMWFLPWVDTKMMLPVRDVNRWIVLNKKWIRIVWDWSYCRFCEVVFLSGRVCPRSLEGWLVLWLPVSQWQQPFTVTPDSTPPPQPVCYLWDARSFPAWRLLSWAGATGALKSFWVAVMSVPVDTGCQTSFVSL